MNMCGTECIRATMFLYENYWDFGVKIFVGVI
jgi:hypothetical protein